jgi:hypothetical protein
MKKILFSFSLILLAAGTLCAQGTLSFSVHHLLGKKDTVPEWTTVTDSIIIKNNGPGLYSGSLGFQTNDIDSANTPAQFVDTTSYFGITLAPGASRYLKLTRTYLTANTPTHGVFRTGINVIVIWPVYNSNQNFMFKDTLRDTVVVMLATGIKELGSGTSLRIYPNPTHSSITIDNNDSANLEVEEIVIYDELGKACYRYKKQRVVDVGNLPKGFWMVEVRFTNGQRGRRKLLIQ